MLLIIFLLLLYGFISQIKEISIIMSTKPFSRNYKKLLISNYICLSTYVGFFSFFVIHTIVAFGSIETKFFTVNNTYIFTFIFLVFLFISKFWIIPKVDLDHGKATLRRSI
ncbi:hypothetical protein NC661_16645 [Aquibacillus koreensis]|uniref:Uncharacterized protein n=1 Tax=Aquibacillus koreensis TaxID=279446 RepID=A0A9X4AJ95_9BACI|nr:hypothetical protein [Aquibacillus koreensis]MCT2536866.1 hypothetical protein [Aquibacillus koreensis]MDC3422002.1 hypothetical protein [Aquibacillus koreensis]